MVLNAQFLKNFSTLSLNVLLWDSFYPDALHLTNIFTTTVGGWRVYGGNARGKNKLILKLAKVCEYLESGFDWWRVFSSHFPNSQTKLHWTSCKCRLFFAIFFHQYQQRWCKNSYSEYRCNVIIGALKALCRL